MNEHCHDSMALIASIITGVVALVGVALTNRANYRRIKLENENNAKRALLELHRERGEELYSATSRWLNMIGGKYLFLLSVMHGEITYNQYLDMAIKSGEKQDYDFSRIEMIIDVYFPSARASYAQVIEARSMINKIDGEHHRAYKNGDIDGRRFIGPYVEAQEKFELAGEELKNQIKICLQAV